MSTIRVITAPSSDTPSDGTLGILDTVPTAQDIDVQKLGQSLNDLSGKIGEMLGSIKQVGDFRLTEVTLAVEISSEGGVALIGSVKAAAKGAFTLTFSA